MATEVPFSVCLFLTASTWARLAAACWRAVLMTERLESAETGFGLVGQGGDTHLASEWGHLSRIWDVEFVQNVSNRNGVCLLSRGEDGACQLWTVELHAGTPPEIPLTARLRAESSDRHHSGKNAWSMTYVNDGQGLLVQTGGADGQIISRRFDVSRGSMASSATLSTPFKDITVSSMSLKHYLFLDSGACLAATDRGDLFRLTASHDKLNWTSLIPNPGSGGLVLCSAESLQLVLVAYQRGGLSALLTHNDSLVPVECDLECAISWMRLASPHSAELPSSTICVVASLANRKSVILWVTSESNTSGEPSCLRHAHGTDSVASVTILQEDAQPSKETIHVLTTGRDGIYAIHRVNWPQSTDTQEATVTAVHRSALPFGPNIEGAFFTSGKESSHVTERNLILYGFRSTSFVVWNETQQSEVLSVECGGPHRSWAFRDCSEFRDGGGKSFVWTKARTLNWHSSRGSNHELIQKGGQGREIKAVARSPVSYDRLQKEHRAQVLIATGAEDTNIQLFAIPRTAKATYRPQPAGEPVPDTSAFRAVSTLKRHNTGIQHLQFSPSGGYLFSSAGCEEFYVWRLTFDVPGIETGVVLWDMMPTQEEDSDARIMSFDLQRSNSGDENAREEYTIVMAYSNGKAKVVRYTPGSSRSKEMFEMLREISYGSFCVMQAFFLSPSFIPASTFGSDELRMGALSAGTNGILNLSLMNTRFPSNRSTVSPDTALESPMEVHKVHQSSVLAMDMVRLNPMTYLVATGGDDNALGLTLLTALPSSTIAPASETNTERQPPSYHFRTLLIPAAHAAALTALKATNLRRTRTGYSIVVVTVGNDQRVNVWDVHVNSGGDNKRVIPSAGRDKLFEAVQVELVGAGWTAVADVSDLDIIEDDPMTLENDVGNGEKGGGERAWSILVVGVGMELLRVVAR
ncbi:hypothetical protein FOPE_01720 [Fonsecaea pedrosoi]|nr:hypothetical protein FOPE_01720 [Fonsecaea pedrosoi]